MNGIHHNHSSTDCLCQGRNLELSIKFLFFTVYHFRLLMLCARIPFVHSVHRKWQLRQVKNGISIYLQMKVAKIYNVDAYCGGK